MSNFRLKVLHFFVRGPKFSMETTRSIRLAIELNELASILDTIDALLHVPQELWSRKYTRFTVQGRIFQFCVLPFGLQNSPLNKVCNPVVCYSRAKSIPIHPYMDNWILSHELNMDTSTRSKSFCLFCFRSPPDQIPSVSNKSSISF